MTQASQRKSAPAPLAPVPFHISQPRLATLENGLKVVMFPDDRLPLVSYRLAFLSGDTGDPPDNIGLTSAMAALLTEGTENYSSRDIAEKTERLGANLSANSSEDFTVISASALSIYNEDILDLLTEILFRPTFPENELDLYRRNTIENLRFQRSQPNFLASEQVARVLYGDHPYSITAPKPEDIERLTRDALVDFRKSRLVPNNAVLMVVGDIDREELSVKIEDEFGGWQEGEAASIPGPSLPARNAVTLTVVDRPGSAQSNIVLANSALERNHPDYFPALVMNQVLGAGASSRIFMNLREEKGYTYGAYSRLDAKRFAGHFEATAEVRTPVTGDSLKEFFYELNRIRDERVADHELEDAKSFLTGVFPIRAETQEGLTNLIVNQQLYGLPDDYLQTYRENVDSVTAEDVQRVAKKYILPDLMALVVVGDGEEILAQAKEFASDVEVLDTSGNPLDAAKYGRADAGEQANATGKWALVLDFQGQQVPVSLTVDQNGKELTGSVDTVLGSGKINSGSVQGTRLSATASTEIQGQSVDLVIAGVIDGDSMAGTISAALLPEPLSFTGTRQK